MIDPHTFGASPAAVGLATMLNERDNARLTRRVSNFLHHTNLGFAALRTIEDDKFFVKFVILWRKDRLQEAVFPLGIESRVKSIITGMSRDWIRSIERLDDNRSMIGAEG